MITLRYILGFVAFVFFVFNPLRANLLTSLAVRAPIAAESKATIIEYATQVSPCNTPIYNALGDTWYTAKNYTLAAFAYGRAIACSPGDGLLRFKYAEMLFMMGFDGRFALNEAIELEPNNPLFWAEKNRIITR